ncbi:MAG: hypothetical protein L3J42_07225 [Hydrogenimonas sp.]|nr:hypothetical protein [Hydrogenimonas sp.]
MNWHKSFTAALVTESIDELLSLIDNIPKFEKTEDMQSALELIKSATEIFERKKSELREQMQKIENQKKFITSSTLQSSVRLDIHS